MRISDWSSDVCSSDLRGDVDAALGGERGKQRLDQAGLARCVEGDLAGGGWRRGGVGGVSRRLFAAAGGEQERGAGRCEDGAGSARFGEHAEFLEKGARRRVRRKCK